MESWNVAVCKRDPEVDYYLLNRDRTPIKFTTRVPFNMGKFLAVLEDIGFPLKYTNGIESIRFRRIKSYYGYYWGDNIDMGVLPRRSMRIYVETFIHEIAHHIDSEEDLSDSLDDERRRRGKHIGHVEARRNNSEYFARGFEKFYSRNPKDKFRLRKRNPRLYRTIRMIHRKYAAK
jgi:hypothetical protein